MEGYVRQNNVINFFLTLEDAVCIGAARFLLRRGVLGLLYAFDSPEPNKKLIPFKVKFVPAWSVFTEYLIKKYSDQSVLGKVRTLGR